MKFHLIILCVATFFSFGSCNQAKDNSSNDLSKKSWDQILKEANGSTATMQLYMGGKDGVQYMTDYVIPTLKEKYNITLNLVPGQGKEIIASVMSEKEAGKDVGQADVVWINGETFYQLRQIDGLYGPYNSLLTNIKYVDMANPIIKYDFQEDIKGFETPWSMANFSLTYDSAIIPNPPVSMQDFEKFWQQHPGTFTLAEDFSGFTLLKTWLIELAGGSKELDGEFDEAKYNKYSKQLWDYINRNKKNFWKNGETFPASNTLVQQMFASGELLFGMSFSNADIDIKIRDGVYPKTVRPLILKAGSIQNASYLGIPFNSGKKSTALVIINFLISPEAQAKKSDLKYTGSRTVLNVASLPETDQKLFQQETGVKYSLSRELLAQRAIREPKPEYMIRIAADFRKYVIQEN